MIDLTRLVRGIDNRPQEMRYENREGSDDSLIPLVVWNMTPACNLACAHCYFGAIDRRADDELTTEEAKILIDDLAAANVPVLVFSGGEPMVRQDLPELTAYATEQGVRPIASSNGTFLTEEKAHKLADAGMAYVGISLDGVDETHDRFRGKEGCFEDAVAGIENAQAAGMSTGIRSTMTVDTIDDLPELFDLSVDLGVDRLNVFHLIYAGRGDEITDRDLEFDRTREMVEYLFDRTVEFADANPDMQVLSAGNYADAVFLYRKICEEMPDRAERARELLFDEGPARVVKKGDSGPKVVNVDHRGDVHPSMFLSHITMGNIRSQPLPEVLEESEVWQKLANAGEHVEGRCGTCPYRNVCGGNSRARASAVEGDLWASDPRCYLTDEELGLADGPPVAPTDQPITQPGEL